MVFSPEGASLDVVTQGPAKKKLNRRLSEISRFVSGRLSIEYIPAIRSDDLAEMVIHELLATELATLEDEVEYSEVLAELIRLQRPILERMSSELTKTIRSFIPDVDQVRVESEAALRHAVRGSARILIDDGAETELAYKGDGVKSLTAIALVRYATRSALRGRHLVLAVEEPEAHLHPNAVHSLRSVLADTAAEHQVLVTTHSPLLVDRERSASNIIVTGGRARVSRNIVEVRTVLGVRLSDNLAGASLVVLAEGESDVVILKAALRLLSNTLRSSFQRGLVALESLGSASALRSKFSQYRAGLCNAHAFVDHDQEGRSAAKRAIDEGVANETEIQFATVSGMSESEIEDLIEPLCYKEAVEERFGVQVSTSRLKGRRQKWSKRMEKIFLQQARTWNRSKEIEIKTLVAECVRREPRQAIWSDRRGTLDALVRTLEGRLRGS